MSVKFRKTYNVYVFDELPNVPYVSLPLPSATYMLLFYMSVDMLHYITANGTTNSKHLIKRLVS